MGMFDWLLKPKPVNVTQTSHTELGPEQKALFAKALPFLQKYADTPLQQFGGSGIAGFSPEELQAQEMYRKNAGGVTQDLATGAAGANKMLMDPGFMLNMNNKPLTDARQAVTDETTQNFLQHVLPGVRSGNIQAGGMYSGGASKAGIAEGQAVGDTSRHLSNSIADMMFQAYNRGISGMGEAVNRNPSVMAQQNLPADMLASVGGQDRAMHQAQLDEQIRKFYTGQMLPFMQGQELMQLLQGMPGGTNVSNVQGANASPSLFQQLAGLGMAGAGVAGKLM